MIEIDVFKSKQKKEYTPQTDRSALGFSHMAFKNLPNQPFNQ